MILEALKPVEPKEIVLDEPSHRILLRVATDDLAVAIGRKGQNARLTSRLIGWRIDIEEYMAVSTDPVQVAITLLVDTFSMDAAIAARLVEMGINSPGAFEGVEAGDLVDAGFTEEEANAIIASVSAHQE